jgi:hypothetical protein
MNLRRYLANNVGSPIDYGERCRSKLPISTSRAEGCVDEMGNARMAKKQRMRWSLQGAHRMPIVCTAVWIAASHQRRIFLSLPIRLLLDIIRDLPTLWHSIHLPRVEPLQAIETL